MRWLFSPLCKRIEPIVIGQDVLSDTEYLKLDYSALEIFGPDSASYLQGQLSQDVESMVSGDSAMSLLLAPTGKIIAICLVGRISSDHFVLLMEDAAVSAVEQRLKKYLIRTKAELKILETGVYLGNRQPLDTLFSVSFANEYFGPNGNVYLSRTEPSEMAAGDREAVLKSSLELERIRSNFPGFISELSMGVFPGALGESLDGFVSFQKGCYVGQELVERMHSRSTAAPILLKVVSVVPKDDINLVELFERNVKIELYDKDLQIGEVTSFALDETGLGVAIAAIKRSSAGSTIFELVVSDGSGNSEMVGRASIRSS